MAPLEIGKATDTAASNHEDGVFDVHGIYVCHSLEHFRAIAAVPLYLNNGRPFEFFLSLGRPNATLGFAAWA